MTILVLVLPLALARPATGALLLPSAHSWGVEDAAAADEIVEYLICDADGACEVLGSGDRSMAGSPIRVSHFLPGWNTLRARYCIATPEGESTGDCGPLSDASTPFRYDGGLSLKQFISHGDEIGGPGVDLTRWNRYEIIIPLGMAPPVGEPEIRFDAVVPEGGARLWMVVKGVRNPWRTYLRTRATLAEGKIEIAQAFPRLQEAMRKGETAVRLRLRVLRGRLLLGQGDPISEDGLQAPQIGGSTLFGSLVTLFDDDADGVPFWPSRKFPSCETSQWLGCSDNCDDRYNPDQADVCEVGPPRLVKR
jgi:hypothetical protein